MAQLSAFEDTDMRPQIKNFFAEADCDARSVQAKQRPAFAEP